MRKLIPVVVMAGVLAASAAVAPKANAQANYTNVSALRPFSPDANYMSLPGYLRYRFLVDSGRWISRLSPRSAGDNVSGGGSEEYGRNRAYFLAVIGQDFGFDDSLGASLRKRA